MSARATRPTTFIFELLMCLMLAIDGTCWAELDSNLQIVDLTDLDGELPLNVTNTTRILWQTQDWEHPSWQNPSWPAGGGDTVGFPSVVKNVHGLNPDDKYYLYYAHHDPMSGIGCAVANSIAGTYTKISSTDSKVLTVPNYNPAGPNTGDPSHYSSPCVVWNEQEQLWFMYFHYYNHYHSAWEASPSHPGQGYQMTALATCPDLSSHNWTIWMDSAWGTVSVWDIVPVHPTTAATWSDSMSSYNSVHRLPRPLANGHPWLAFLRGSKSTGGTELGFASSPDGSNWIYFAENPVIASGDSWTLPADVYRPKFIGYLGENESGADEYLVAWAETDATASIIYSKTTNFVTFTRDPRGYANWGGNDGGMTSAYREGGRLYLFGGKYVHEMVLPLQDQDGDGMNDDWEEQHFGSTTNSSGGVDEDWDHDGFRDLYEYIAGTDPTNASSLLIISDAWTESTDDYVLKWLSVTNRQYSILQSPELTGPWSLSASNLVGTAPLNVHTVDMDSAQEFFRIGVKQ